MRSREWDVLDRSPVRRQSRVIRDAIKHDRHLTVRGSNGPRTVLGIELIVEWLKHSYSSDSALQEVLGPNHLLISIPRSAPLTRLDALWPSRRICQTLVAAELGAEVAPLLVRHTAVQKSAFAAAGQRPSAKDHLNSSKIDDGPALVSTHENVTLVDDFVTRGATFIGMYPHVRQAFPHAAISCFAVVRTISFDPISTIVAPIKGVITTNLFGNTRREP